MTLYGVEYTILLTAQYGSRFSYAYHVQKKVNKMNETNVIADKSLQVFNSPQFGEIRTALSASNEPLFCLTDVCKALSLESVGKVKQRLSPRGVTTIHTPTYNQHGAEVVQQLNFITEPNLYKCIFQSRKKEAEAFQDWVCNEVLPSIRKTGGYIATKESDTPEEIMARALAIAKDTFAKREKRIKTLEAEGRRKQDKIEDQRAIIETKTETINTQNKVIEEQAPKVKYYNETLQAVNTLTTTQVAKSIGMDAQKLNKKLKDAGITYRQSGQWLLYSPYCNRKLHATRTQTFTRSDGSIGASFYTVWTQRGARFITALSQCEWNIKNAINSINGKEEEL